MSRKRPGRVRQAFTVAAYNFRLWHKNPRIFITFALAFILCFLLSDKAVSFAMKYDIPMQIAEPFIWTFGDCNSILLSSLLLVLLFADMPFISKVTPYYLMKINRSIWLTGQAIYILGATAVYLMYILAATSVISMKQSFIGNMWSETAAILGYSGSGKVVYLPAVVKTMEMSSPYEAMLMIILLMLLYALLMVFIMLLFNILRGPAAGVISVFIFSLYGFLLNPIMLKKVFQIHDEAMFKINVALGWISPLNHAVYHMHNFGYDLLPRLWHTIVIFIVLTTVCFFSALYSIKRYNFNFSDQQ